MEIINTVEDVLQPVLMTVTDETVKSAYDTLQKYKQGKANLEKRIIENEQWWKLRHWDCLRVKDKSMTPTSAWLFNVLANKHADAMDNIPAPTILPREADDRLEAKTLSQVIPVVMEQNDFTRVYSDAWWYKLKTGTAVYGVFWDQSKHNGLGDISVRKADILNLFWEPGVTDIQRSRNLFHVELVHNDVLSEMYPQLDGKLGNTSADVAQYIYDDAVDTTDKTPVVDWYYRKQVGGQTVLHYCKFANGVVLFATENEPENYPNGWYEHGQYPFVFDTLFPEEGTPAGFGYIDLCKDPQMYIDMLSAGILQNALLHSRPRYFVRDDGNVNEEEYADPYINFIHVNGNLGEESVRQIVPSPLNNIYMSVYESKITELKETSGNRDVNTGGTQSGLTAASAIAAVQEMGSKLTRDMLKTGYDAYTEVVRMVIELMRQFYNLPRTFRIIGTAGQMEFVSFTNAGMRPMPQGVDFGVDTGLRKPEFDIEVSAQKASAYSKMAQNEMALQFYQLGFFNPQLAQQSLACLEMMDFDRKDTVMERIQQGGMMYQQMLMQQQMMAAASMSQNPEKESGLVGNDSLGNAQTKEHAFVEKARQRAAESTSPV